MISLRWIVNGAMMGLPVGVTLAVLFAIQPWDPSMGSGEGNRNGPWSGTDNKVITSTYCDKTVGITPPAKGMQYTFNPNQWGIDANTVGGLCMNVTANNNGTYATNTTAPLWSTTWSYTQGPDTQPVHAFPNAMIDKVLPDRLSDITTFNLIFGWTYGQGNETAETTDVTSLAANSLNANVAMDLFIDSDSTKAQNSSQAGYEIMVWFAAIGAATQPIGLSRGAVATETVGDVTFSLYTGQNFLGQNVLSWVPASAVEKIDTDVLPLVTKILSMTGDSYPSDTDYLGHLSIGSEAYYSDGFVTFSVSELAIDLRTK
ncbi:concanavalin A-like lectin/glucanase [Ceratocystis lukuohia]|uniref:Concanavalin A-like lectin/glucanase n=2 Tax=Ceratocystis TaxID=5157 RepID=A0ABR4MQ82_9PEZI|nr:putative xyloglucan-specific endo-beta-1 4-glucanase A [Ceratocystis platani]